MARPRNQTLVWFTVTLGLRARGCQPQPASNPTKRGAFGCRSSATVDCATFGPKHICSESAANLSYTLRCPPSQALARGTASARSAKLFSIFLQAPVKTAGLDEHGKTIP